ncbi:DUF2149 domain-containing protein [Porphyromonas circumdentaria]|uniref:DUF2149 domain-containing protein n=1 Tax=Porphyromonas circumdentaria TaxID=29524 RepID=A0A1T4NY46_9PORP|nr:DUF2149 domain-containing protein [Porphyromonas circumdentaria]MBB6276224.1 hypothetical protein [Porphyromonas circumdentaria]MDO4722303.1 DUF2149 domain-containing protein [Porphyromonas circumdentaria]SJZ83977.1 hypothetical protein SAMN02745171_01257 [Porphyromonas circumdentaria]
MSRRRFSEEEPDPSSLVSNLFDIAMVFALALMVALVTKFNMTEVFSKEDYTIVKNPGKDNMELLIKKGDKIEKFTPSNETDSSSGSKGKRVGTAYQLENGEIVYIPEEAE